MFGSGPFFTRGREGLLPRNGTWRGVALKRLLDIEEKSHAKTQSRKGKTEKRFLIDLWLQTFLFFVSLWVNSCCLGFCLSFAPLRLCVSFSFFGCGSPL